ncbi:MAG TPA: amidohydrolase family protein [Candidatus Limnocylindrales bacterium]
MSETWRLPEVVLPDGDRRPLWIRDGRLTAEPIDHAAQLPGRFALPGLVDAHAHVTLLGHEPGGAIGGVRNLLELRGQGVLLVRDVGAPQSATLDLEPHPELPTLIAAGSWHAPEGRFFPAFHVPVPTEVLVPSALTELARGAKWIKVIADWTTPELSYPFEALKSLIDVVHAAGGRVAAHTQWQGAARVVEAGVDSIEHGCLVDEPTLEVMAARGVGWTPTLTAFAQALPADAPPDRVARRERALANYRAMLPVARRLGVPILAGTDTAGTIADEVGSLVEYGLEPADALRSATTVGRVFLGEPGLDDGAAADVVTFDDDPRDDPDVLRRPAAVVLRGRRVG